MARSTFLTSKGPFPLKKPTRTVLPDSTLTARSNLLAAIARTGTTKKDAKRDTVQTDSKQPSQVQPLQPSKQQDTETGASTRTANASATNANANTNTSTGSMEVSKHVNGSGTATGTMNPGSSPVPNDTTLPSSSATNGTGVESKDPESSSTADASLTGADAAAAAEQPNTRQNSNPFLVPLPIRQPPGLPEWASNQSKRHSNHEKTTLPEINDDDLHEEEEEYGSGNKKAGGGSSSSNSKDDSQSHSHSKSSGGDVRGSGSDGGDRMNLSTFESPAWAQHQELEKALVTQCTVNPEDIFGPLPVLVMHDIFPGGNPYRKTGRIRTSSAHWGHADRLTAKDVVQYKEDMGWTKSSTSTKD
ncbi:hypothetical protein BGX31_002503 [Mortierella sp. GBA43]|nr:hypothetical protein BGX31_002503 [Mortierella sp. GBA43]